MSCVADCRPGRLPQCPGNRALGGLTSLRSHPLQLSGRVSAQLRDSNNRGSGRPVHRPNSGRTPCRTDGEFHHAGLNDHIMAPGGQRSTFPGTPGPTYAHARFHHLRVDCRRCRPEVTVDCSCPGPLRVDCGSTWGYLYVVTAPGQVIPTYSCVSPAWRTAGSGEERDDRRSPRPRPRRERSQLERSGGNQSRRGASKPGATSFPIRRR